MINADASKCFSSYKIGHMHLDLMSETGVYTDLTVLNAGYLMVYYHIELPMEDTITIPENPEPEKHTDWQWCPKMDIRQGLFNPVMAGVHSVLHEVNRLN